MGLGYAIKLRKNSKPSQWSVYGATNQKITAQQNLANYNIESSVNECPTFTKITHDWAQNIHDSFHI